MVKIAATINGDSSVGCHPVGNAMETKGPTMKLTLNQAYNTDGVASGTPT